MREDGLAQAEVVALGLDRHAPPQQLGKLGGGGTARATGVRRSTC